MRKLFGVLIVIALVVVGFGFYRGWFTLSTSNPNSDADKTKVDLTVDRAKMNDDATTVKNKAAALTDEANSQAAKPRN